LSTNRLVRLLLWLLAGATLVLLYGPLVATFVYSFVSRRAGTIDWSSFTFDWYRLLLFDQNLRGALFNSVLIGFVAVAISLVVGMMLAFYSNDPAARGRGLIQAIVFLPFVMPPIITGLALLIFFRETDVPRSLVTVTIGHVVFVLAVVYRTLLARLQALRRSLVEASYDLGADRWQTFRFVLLPNLMTAIVASAVLAFALSFDETLITLFLASGESTLPLRLWGMMRIGFTPEINALVTLIILLSTGLFLAVARFFRR
jgi:putative spermidine/putrescine transport system permease protein/spermidine/putrescine transport system permease protein